MEISTHITVEDHQEYVQKVHGKSVWRRLGIFARWELLLIGLLVAVSIAGFFWTLGSFFSRAEAIERLLGDPIVLAAIVLGLLLTVFAVKYLKHIIRVRRDLKTIGEKGSVDDACYRDGVNIGAVHFKVDESGICVFVRECTSRYAWRAFQVALESPRNLYLVIGRDAAVILPKRGVEEGSLNELRAHIARHLAMPERLP